MGRTTLDTAALAHELRLAVMRFSRRLRNQRVDTAVTLTHLAALSTLQRHGPMSPGELAGRLQELTPGERAALREAAGIMDELAVGDLHEH